jgi:hypothetical protein
VEKKNGGKTPPRKKPVSPIAGISEDLAASDPAVTTGESTEQKKRVRNFRSYAKRRVSEDFPKIVDAMSKKSIEGSLAHTKYLFEIGGVKEEIESQTGDKHEPSLSELLIGEIKRRQTERACEEVPEAETIENRGLDDEAVSDATDEEVTEQASND